MPVRLHHIADLCQCSQATVSRALRNDPAISDSVQNRIQQVARQMGYHRHATRLLRQMKTVVVAHGTLAGLSPGMADLLQQGTHGGVSFVFLSHDGDPDREESLMVAARRFAGGLIVLTANAALLGALEGMAPEAPPPGKRVPRPPLRTVAFRLDDRAGTREATDYLAQLGHTAIAFLGGPPALPHMRERIEGYREGLRLHGLSVPDAWVAVNGVSTGDGDAEAMRLLTLEPRPTALVAACDALAAGALQAAARLGLRVPGELSLAGFGNRPCSLEGAVPLTTLEYAPGPTADALATAVREITDNTPAPGIRTLVPRLLIRGSCTYTD